MSELPFIPIAKPWLGEEEIQAVQRPLCSGWTTQGPEVAQFEKEFAAYVGSPYACAVSSCTTALHLALIAVGIKPGDEVITVSHSFIATANAIRYCQAVPVFVDIDPQTFNMDPALVETAITPKTKAILAVHQIGMPCDLKMIVEVARKHHLPVIEDAACAAGSEILWQNEWQKIGKPHGDIACFSFHPRKVISIGDGGMLTTSNPEWDKKFRLLRQHGMSIPDTVRHGSSKVILESYECLGYNYRMTDLQAAIGREQLKKLPQIVALRRKHGARYQKLLASIRWLTPPAEPAFAHSNWQSFCVRVSDEVETVEIMQVLLDKKIASKRGIMCSHRQPAYPFGTWLCWKRCGKSGCEHLIKSEYAEGHSLLLPLFPQMTEAEQDRVVEALYDAAKVKVESTR